MGARIWKLTVLDSGHEPVELTVLAAQGHVHLIPPQGEPWIVPYQSDDQIVDTIRQARTVANEQART